MKCVYVTIGLPLILSIYNPGNIKWYIDAAFSVQKDMISHTGGFMTIGTWGAYIQSRKQKMNTKSSTEAKLVRVNNIPTQVICTQYFLRDQGY